MWRSFQPCIHSISSKAIVNAPVSHLSAAARPSSSSTRSTCTRTRDYSSPRWLGGNSAAPRRHTRWALSAPVHHDHAMRYGSTRTHTEAEAGMRKRSWSSAFILPPCKVSDDTFSVCPAFHQGAPHTSNFRASRALQVNKVSPQPLFKTCGLQTRGVHLSTTTACCRALRVPHGSPAQWSPRDRASHWRARQQGTQCAGASPTRR